MATQYSGTTPRHLWVVGILSLLWNAFGAVDYTMTETGNLAYFESMGLGREEFDFYTGLPAWAVGVWAIGVWGSVLGSVLLLLRSRFAPLAFLASLIGAAISFAYQYSRGLPESQTSGFAAVMPIVILIAIVAQWYYSRRMLAAGVLR